MQPVGWRSEYTTELLNLLNVPGWLVSLEPAKAALLERICATSIFPATELRATDVLAAPLEPGRVRETPAEGNLFT